MENIKKQIYCTKMLPLPYLYIVKKGTKLINTFIPLEDVADTNGEFHIEFFEQDGYTFVKIITNKSEIPLPITKKYLLDFFGDFNDDDVE